MENKLQFQVSSFKYGNTENLGKVGNVGGLAAAFRVVRGLGRGVVSEVHGGDCCRINHGYASLAMTGKSRGMMERGELASAQNADALELLRNSTIRIPWGTRECRELGGAATRFLISTNPNAESMDSGLGFEFMRRGTWVFSFLSSQKTIFFESGLPATATRGELREREVPREVPLVGERSPRDGKAKIGRRFFCFDDHVARTESIREIAHTQGVGAPRESFVRQLIRFVKFQSTPRGVWSRAFSQLDAGKKESV